MNQFFKDKRIFLVIVLSIVVFNSCSVYEYIPNSINVPLLKGKNELNSNFSFYDFQLSYAITNHIAITGNYFNREQEYNTGWGDEYAKRTIRKNKFQDFEFGIGLFRYKKPFYVEFYGGLSTGNFMYFNQIRENHEYTYRYSASSKMFKIYVQPNFGYELEIDNNIIQIAFSTKVTSSRYKNLEINYIPPDSIYKIDDTNVWYINGNKNYIFVQPAITLRQGTKYFNFQVQYGLNKCINSEIKNIKEYYLCVSCFFRISEFFKFGKRNK